MPSRLNQYEVTVKTAFSANFWNATFADIDSRLTAVEALEPTLNAAADNLASVGLARINSILGPSLTQLLNVQNLGFLIASSNTSVQLTVGMQPTFLLSNPDQVATFTPSPFVALTRQANYTDFAVARTIGYNKSAGAFVCQIIALFGNAGNAAYNDWVIAGTAGVVVAENQMLTAVQAAATQTAADRVQTDADAAATASDRTAVHTDRVAADASAAAASSSANAAATSATQAQTAAASMSGGPVTSVNSKTGVVTLAAGDVGALAVASNLSDLQNPKVARTNLQGSKRYASGDANYPIPSDAKVVATNAILTSPRTWTLPAASSLNPGERLTFVDEAGGITAANTMTLACSGSDTINGASANSFSSTYSEILLESDGVSKWTYDVQGVSRGGTGATTASGARTNLGAAASGANSDINSLSGLTTPLSVAQGGTGSTTQAAALANIGAAPATTVAFSYCAGIVF